MAKLSDSFREAVKAQVDRTSLIRSEWICENFTNPKDDRQKWSWKDHEFQIEIADQSDDTQEVVVIKPAQTGLSTLQIRLVLAFLAQRTNLKAAYVLPTSKFAGEFTQSRINSTISTSPAIAAIVSGDADNTSMKKVGSCFLLIRGTSGASAAISFDLDMIVTDEVDFCNQATLSTYSSRLQHSDLKLRRDFSTPTLPAYGISAMYADSSMAVRLVKCEHCNTWVELTFFNDVVVPGFNANGGDKSLAEFRTEDSKHLGIRAAWYKCPSCGGKVSEERLNDPAARQWVDKYAGHWRKGFRVSPWDVPRYNPLWDILSSIKKYSYGDWVNFRLGLSYESAENSFLQEVFKRMCIIRPVTLAELVLGGVYGTYIGVDLGKISHVIVGVAGPSGLQVICAERVKVAALPEQNLGKYLVQLARATRCVRLVIDTAPDYTVSLYAHAMYGGFGAEYGAVGAGAGLDIYTWNEDKGVVRVDRDGHFDDLATWHNAGRIQYPMGETSVLLGEHMSVMKKAKVQVARGIAEKWVSTSEEDHFAHALGYCFAGFSAVMARFGVNRFIMPPTVGAFKMKEVGAGIITLQ